MAEKSAERKRGSGAKSVYTVLRNEILDLTLEPGRPLAEEDFRRLARSAGQLRFESIRPQAKRTTPVGW